MDEGKSMNEKVDAILEQLNSLKDKDKSKKWNLPFMTRIGMGKKRKRNGWMVFANIHNRAISFIKAPVIDNVALVNNVPHVIEPEDVLLWKNKLPMVIQPQWSERPFSPKDHFKQTVEAGQHTKGWQYIMNFILKSQIQAKKNFSYGLLIIGALALIGLGYYLIKSGAFK